MSSFEITPSVSTYWGVMNGNTILSNSTRNAFPGSESSVSPASSVSLTHNAPKLNRQVPVYVVS
jgi:hypothetical protein